MQEKANLPHPICEPSLTDTEVQDLTFFMDDDGEWTEVRSR